jgi:hypothetical protein
MTMIIPAANGRNKAYFCFAGEFGLSAWPIISNKKRLGFVSRGLPHFMRVNASDIVSFSCARVIPT